MRFTRNASALFPPLLVLPMKYIRCFGQTSNHPPAGTDSPLQAKEAKQASTVSRAKNRLYWFIQKN